MGNDGGVIATSRKLLVKTKAAEHKGAEGRARLEAAAAAARLATCALSGAPLRAPAPVVCDELGSLFLKEALLVYLLAKQPSAAFAHIRSLKRDTVAVVYCANAASSAGAAVHVPDSARGCGRRAALLCATALRLPRERARAEGARARAARGSGRCRARRSLLVLVLVILVLRRVLCRVPRPA